MVTIGKERERKIKREKGNRRRPDLGCEYTMGYTNDVFYSCTPKSCIMLLTNTTPINVIKKELGLIKNKFSDHSYHITMMSMLH